MGEIENFHECIRIICPGPQSEAEQQQAAAAQAAAQRPVPAAPMQKSTQQKLDELDKLAAGGHITPQEYKEKKKKILDSM